MWSAVSGRKSVGNHPNKGAFWDLQEREYLAKTEIHFEGQGMIDMIFEYQLFRASI